ncbi:hypothetical protein [Pantoea agglomerans]|uniref:Uncharacterized protein n=1 Tax=Enterobacter agglomerans TaxID=549 RepID=A0AAN2F9S1_ENTAG|nr:hypothetical protein [Pantoea agglomerans]CAH6160762.1 hypothetical protein DAPPPG734_01355 [Pantoea agglomerans]
MKSFDDSESTRNYFFSAENIRVRLKDYAFSEVEDIFHFLTLFRKSPPGNCEYVYIRSKLGLCLKHHDNQSDYFIPLREFAAELDCLISFH